MKMTIQRGVMLALFLGSLQAYAAPGIANDALNEYVCSNPGTFEEPTNQGNCSAGKVRISATCKDSQGYPILAKSGFLCLDQNLVNEYSILRHDPAEQPKTEQPKTEQSKAVAFSKPATLLQALNQCYQLLGLRMHVSSKGVIALNGRRQSVDDSGESPQKVQQIGAYTLTPDGKAYFHSCQKSCPLNQQCPENGAARVLKFPRAFFGSTQWPDTYQTAATPGLGHMTFRKLTDTPQSNSQSCLGDRLDPTEAEKFFSDKLTDAIEVPDARQAMVNTETLTINRGTDFWQQREAGLEACRKSLRGQEFQAPGAILVEIGEQITAIDKNLAERNIAGSSGGGGAGSANKR